MEAIELAERAGLDLDPWQQLVLTDGLGERADGKWAAKRVGLNVPRQNGKGSILEARELAGAVLFGEKLIIHSAHEQRTSSEHFQRLLALIEEAEFQSRIRKVSNGKGAEAIWFTDGTRILFVTRTGGGGRGLTGHLVVLDEAMILPEKTVSALGPTLAAQSVTGNPQLWYAGSAVDQQEQDNGVVFGRLRQSALDGTPGVAWLEWSAPGPSPDALTDEQRADREFWAMANPGLGIRISEDHIADECSGLLGPRGFAVERLGVGDWPEPDEGGNSPIGVDDWDSCRDPVSAAEGPVCFAFDVRPDRSMSAIYAAGRRGDGDIHAELVEHRAGTGWVAARLKDLTARHDFTEVRCAKSSPASAVLPSVKNLGVDVAEVGPSEHAEACGLLQDLVEQRRVRHRGELATRTALKGAAKKTLGDSWLWSRTSSGVDISPLVAATLAVHGAESTTGSVYGQRGVVAI